MLLLTSGCQAQTSSAAKTEAGNANPLSKLKPLLKPSAPAGQLQEVPPPLAVQQIQASLADRQPRVSIKAPSDGADLASGNWNLALQISDWPISDGGSIGPGPHVVVQIDDQEPIRLTSANLPDTKKDLARTNQTIQISLPPLTPGSHRITTYAAMPWGEAVRSPGAASQIRVQRVAANPLTLPKKGSPQLLLVSPPLETSGEPVLLDWLLLDAPLQRLRDNDGSWRLRVNLNGDSFITDQDVPLWLKGWKNGSNSLQLDLIDGRGNPLNPPFNSLVSEVILKSSAPKPRWQLGRLSPEELAMLLGQTPNLKKEIGQAKALPTEAPLQAPAPEKQIPPKGENPKELWIEPKPENIAPNDSQPEESNLQEISPEGQAAEPEEDEQLAIKEQIDEIDEIGEDRQNVENQDEEEEEEEAKEEEKQDETSQAPEPESQPDTEYPAGEDLVTEDLAAEELSAQEEITENIIKPDFERNPISNPERIAPSTTVAGSAREQVREDGSMIKAKRPGPFAGLRERLGT